jgi:hypothetical protein
MLYLEVWPEAWMALRHTCPSLVIWGHRRVVEITCEFFVVVKDFEEGASHAPACCAGRRSWRAPVCFFDQAGASSAVEHLLPLQTACACVLGMTGMQFRLKLRFVTSTHMSLSEGNAAASPGDLQLG